jgi:hypothetical protein
VSPVFIITVVLLAIIVYMIYRKQPGRSISHQPATLTRESEDQRAGIEGEQERTKELEASSETESDG